MDGGRCQSIPSRSIDDRSGGRATGLSGALGETKRSRPRRLLKSHMLSPPHDSSLIRSIRRPRKTGIHCNSGENPQSFILRRIPPRLRFGPEKNPLRQINECRLTDQFVDKSQLQNVTQVPILNIGRKEGTIYKRKDQKLQFKRWIDVTHPNLLCPFCGSLLAECVS